MERDGPYRFFFYGNEGFEPPHIPVRRSGILAKFWLDRIERASSTGFRPHELFEIQPIVEANAMEFEEVYNFFHEPDRSG